MSERTVIVLSAIAGAGLGAVAGFLLLTERGRAMRRELEPRIEELTRELAALQRTATRAAAAAQDGWRALNDAAARQQWSAEPVPVGGTAREAPPSSAHGAF